MATEGVPINETYSLFTGLLGNCYFMAAIAGCAISKDDILIKDLLIEDFGDCGMYGVKFFVNGRCA